MNQTETPTTTPAAPPTPAPAYPLLPDEPPDIVEHVRQVIPDAERWLDTPNHNFCYVTPRSLIGTEQEWFLRSLLRAIKYGLYW
jgi:hypothetical protein